MQASDRSGNELENIARVCPEEVKHPSKKALARAGLVREASLEIADYGQNQQSVALA